MKILHIAPNAPYNDYWGYQDNLLPKYHKKMGHDVTLIITNFTHKDGKIVQTECDDYRLDDGVRVIRLKAKNYLNRALTNVKAKLSVMPYLKEIRPDFIFFHGLISDSIYDVVKYKKQINPACIIVRDNHLDYNIGSKAKTWEERLIRAYYRQVNRRTMNYVSRVYGVTPWRKTYAEDYFAIPPEKTDVLIMGADDEKIDFSNRESIRVQLRSRYDVGDSDFLVVTGGKIDRKKNICQLMEAVGGMQNAKLLIFGQVAQEVKAEFDALVAEHKNIIYIGWIDSDRVYDYFFAADLVCFPGQHSVLWEQACAAKVPCAFQRWEGMEHVNNGGNSAFFEDISAESIRDTLLNLKFTQEYKQMLDVARSEKTDIYLYSKIAEKSLECGMNDESV